MSEHDWLASRFEENRTHLRSVAYRILGSTTEAEDALQEAWLKLSRADTSGVDNLAGWLTTVVARVCLDMLRSRTSRREQPLEAVAEPVASVDPEQQALLADSMGPALLVVLDTLAPAERLAFVLHDLFAVPFDEIAPIVGRTTTATRQLASRARRRVQGVSPVPGADRTRQRAIVDAFFTAARSGDFDALLALLDPDVVLRADAETVRAGGQDGVRGAAAVAGTFSGRARFAELALVDGLVGAIWAPGGQPRVVFGFTIADDRIVEVSLRADPDYLREVEVEILR